ncbi:hypothetical protein RI129_008046 [Pyrocoelia pectoralis]|uniref:Metallo-beta-lactamase domain-containing protein 1 n=1 Tax=Pyrocoelia pectoralis TaxID=417401 RepID=A0AAN7VEP4_9COLE
MSTKQDYEITVLFTGYSTQIEQGMLANCTCTLLKGPKLIIVDTMTAWDGDRLTEALGKHDVNRNDIDFVICTHGHSDHIGCNYLFRNAHHIVGNCISHKNTYYTFNFADNPYKIDDNVSVIATPGHTLQDVTVLVKNVNGLTAIVGDLFENEKDLEDERIWKDAGSDSEELQLKNREKILAIADWIIPGHGAKFKVNKIK